jgi:hypothetical protein
VLGAMTERTPVAFKSERWQLKGYLYHPDGHGRRPCVIMCHGFTGTMDRLFDGAEQFCESGLSVMVYLTTATLVKAAVNRARSFPSINSAGTSQRQLPLLGPSAA